MGETDILRVIAGEAGGLKLETLKSMATRPTADRVKEAMFNIISPYICDSVVLDLFGGSGSLGIEALSRGAKHAVFADISKESCEIIRKNLVHTRLIEKAEIINSSFDIVIKSLVSKSKSFDIVLLDPPYNKNFIQDTLKNMLNNDIISNNGILIAEHHENDKLPERSGKLVFDKCRKYGDTLVSVFKVSGHTHLEKQAGNVPF